MPSPGGGMKDCACVSGGRGVMVIGLWESDEE